MALVTAEHIERMAIALRSKAADIEGVLAMQLDVPYGHEAARDPEAETLRSVADALETFAGGRGRFVKLDVGEEVAGQFRHWVVAKLRDEVINAPERAMTKLPKLGGEKTKLFNE